MHSFPIKALWALALFPLSSCVLHFGEVSSSAPSSSTPESSSSTPVSSPVSSISYLGKITLSGECCLSVGEKESLSVSLSGASLSCLEEGMVSFENDVVTALHSGVATLVASYPGYEDGLLSLEILPKLSEVRSYSDGTSFKAKGSVSATSKEGYLLEDDATGESYLYVEDTTSYSLGQEVLVSATLTKHSAPSGMDLKATSVTSSLVGGKFRTSSTTETTLTGESLNAYSGEKKEHYLIRKATTSLKEGLLLFSLPLLSGSKRSGSLHYSGSAPKEGTYDLEAYFTNVLENGVVEGFLIKQTEFLPSAPQGLKVVSNNGKDSLSPGNSLQLTAIADPYDALQDVAWSMEDSSGNFTLSTSGYLTASANAPLQSSVRIRATSLWSENPLSAFLDIVVVKETTSSIA
jgi:hypothetical protein